MVQTNHNVNAKPILKNWHKINALQEETQGQKIYLIKEFIYELLLFFKNATTHMAMYIL